MTRTFHVTLTPQVREYTDSSMYEVVHADSVRVDDVGALHFVKSAISSDDRLIWENRILWETGHAVVTYAPGTWILYTEDIPKPNLQETETETE